MMFLRHTLHDTHYEQVMIVCQIDLFEDWCHLKLVGCHLVMPRPDRDTCLESFVLQIAHERQHTCRNSSEIMILELLRLGAIMSHERTTGEHQIRTGVIKRFIHQEILLFPAEVRVYVFDLFIKVRAHLTRGMTERCRGADERRLIIERLTRICHKDGRDKKSVTDEEDRRRRIPR